MPLTHQEVQKLTEEGRHYDGGGLYLEVMPSGKYWRLKYRFVGKEKRLALGVFPAVSLKEAREKRDFAKRQLAEGIDPGQAKKDAKLEERLRAVNSFDAVAREWVTKQDWTKVQADRVLRSFELHVFPKIGARPLAEVDALEILEHVLRPLEKEKKLEMAGRVKQRISGVFTYGIVTRRCKVNPATDLQKAITAHKAANYPRIREDEIPEFLKRLESYKGHPATPLAIRLLMLTFVRTGEMRHAQWPEFNFEAAEWRIPAERMKQSREHIVPLSRQAIEVVKQLRAYSGASPFVVPNLYHPLRPMSENTVNKALVQLGYKDRMTGHGFRGLASTVLNEKGFDADWIERQLAHVEKSKVRAAYNHAEYLPQRRRMMQAWADLLDGVGGVAKVLPMRGHLKGRTTP